MTDLIGAFLIGFSTGALFCIGVWKLSRKPTTTTHLHTSTGVPVCKWCGTAHPL